MYGDYDYLSKMYGLSGISGKHPFLWSEIPSEMMSVPPSQREAIFESRNLGSLEKNLEFQNVHQSNIKKAKFVKNVIDKRFFNVPLMQVCLPGLNITLGVVFKFVQLYEILARDLDFRIAAEIAKANLSISDAESDELVAAYKKVVDIERVLVEFEETRVNIVDEMNWASIVSSTFDEENYTSVLKDVADEVVLQQQNLRS